MWTLRQVLVTTEEPNGHFLTSSVRRVSVFVFPLRWQRYGAYFFAANEKGKSVSRNENYFLFILWNAGCREEFGVS